MTKEQRAATKLALYRHAIHCGRHAADHDAWEGAIAQAERYYKKNDPLRAELMRLRYFERNTEEETINALSIGRTTYQKANFDVLSTVAVYAARRGAEV